MPQLHLYVSDDVAEKIKRKAEKRRLTTSRYLAEVVKRDLGRGWPEGYFETVVGGWKGESLERPPQGEFEERHEL